MLLLVGSCSRETKLTEGLSKLATHYYDSRKDKVRKTNIKGGNLEATFFRNRDPEGSKILLSQLSISCNNTLLPKGTATRER